MSYDAAARLKKHPAGTTRLDVIRVEPPHGVAMVDFHESVYAIANELFAREPRIVGTEA